MLRVDLPKGAAILEKTDRVRVELDLGEVEGVSGFRGIVPLSDNLRLDAHSCSGKGRGQRPALGRNKEIGAKNLTAVESRRRL